LSKHQFGCFFRLSVLTMDWPGLMAWSTQFHDGTAPSEFKQMTDEDRKFLEQAMEDAFGKIEDPNKIMAEATAKLKATDRTDQSIITALEVIDKCCDDPDCARNVEKLDGLQPLLDLLSTHTDAICNRALEILALLFANNPKIQEAGARRGALEIFLRLVHESGAGSETKSKAFRALVALLRQEQALEQLFVKEKDGVNVVISCLAPSDLRLCEKAASFARTLTEQGLLRAEEVAILATALTPLVRAIGSGQISYRETLSECMSSLAQSAPQACPAELKAAVEDRLKELPVATGEDVDAVERANLQEFLSLLSASGAA